MANLRGDERGDESKDTTVADLTVGVEVRMHNGQCGYGPWMAIDDPDVPSWLAGLVAD